MKNFDQLLFFGHPPPETLVPWSPGAHAANFSFQWSKWAGEIHLRKNQVFWSTFVFWSISSDTLVSWSPWSPGAQAAYLSFQWSKWAGKKNLSQLPVVKMSWGKKSKKKPSFLTYFHFLVNFIRFTGLMVTRGYQYVGGLSHLLEVQKGWREKLRRNPMFWPVFKKF